MKSPTLFLGHGSPLNAIQENSFTQIYKDLGQTLSKPKAILFISAHWETEGSWITGMERPKTIHDFRGFPKELYEIHYHAKGSPDLASYVQSQVKGTHIQIDKENWGLDHGCWSVLLHMYPKADVPVLQLSIDQTKPFNYHFDLGRKLSFLRDEGVMILGSGNIVHNLRNISWEPDAPPLDWAIEFDQWFQEKVKAKDYEAIINDPLKSKAGKLSVPSPDHYIPLLYVLGASRPNEDVNFVMEGVQNAAISMTSFMFGQT